MFKKLSEKIKRAFWEKPDQMRRNSILGLLQHARSVGFQPGTVIDVGAAQGSFTRECHAIFPKANYLLVEPLEENRPFLIRLAESLHQVTFVIAAATPRAGEIPIHVHSHLDGSSLYAENDGEAANGVLRIVPAVTLDGLLVEHPTPRGPFIIKVDVQGAELDVLRGAKAALKQADYVILETSLFQFFQNGPQIHDVIQFMRERGWVVYDLAGLSYRPLDNALAQMDLAFVKDDCFFRRDHGYANPDQRDELNRRFSQFWEKKQQELRLHSRSPVGR
jgi:FkbM family methyltransferase